MTPTPGLPLVTRLRIEAEGADLIECAGELDRATRFVLRRQQPPLPPMTMMKAGVVSMNGANAVTTTVAGAVGGEMLFAGSHKFVEDVYESKITPHGTVYYIGRRVISLDELEVDDGFPPVLKGPMDGMPQVPSVPFALEVDGSTRAIAVSATAGPGDIFDAIVASSWFKPLPDASRYQLQAFYDSAIRTLYEAPLRPLPVSVDGGSVLLTAWKAEDLAGMQPLYFCPSEVIARTSVDFGAEYVDGVLFSPPRADRIGDGVAVEVVVSGQRTSVWLAADCSAWQAARYAARAQGFGDISSVSPDGRGWEVRDCEGNLLATAAGLHPLPTTSIVGEIGPELFPLYVNPPAGVGG